MRYNRNSNRLDLSQKDTHNFFRIQGEEFFLENLEKGSAPVKGGNSSIFRALHPDGTASYVVKFFRYFRELDFPGPQRRLQRFEREIQALKEAQASEFRGCVVQIVDDGVFPVFVEGGRKTLRYYVMSEADSDLAFYLRENDLSLPQRVFLCSELLRILRDLHSLGIYHRDIKPENIFMVDGRPLLGDLGLINFRNQDSDLDYFDEKIGPTGFLSPEATNKCFGIRNRESFSFDCSIDEKSDIFQLGQIFWLVLQDEVPTGHLETGDVKFSLGRIFPEIIIPMLQYPKARRASADDVGAAFAPILQELALA
jgi:serine/threonine protein kinase